LLVIFAGEKPQLQNKPVAWMLTICEYIATIAVVIWAGAGLLGVKGNVF